MIHLPLKKSIRLLIVTQVVDTDDPVLGFVHRWLEAFSGKFESIEVICLKEGKHALPANVSVHSLGKEHKIHTRTDMIYHISSRVGYSVRFLWLIGKLRNRYDAVFVHMNQEYVLIGGDVWFMLAKPVYLWRNHYKGSWLTDVASLYCKKIFCTSVHSYTVKYKKTVIMPVGVDSERFSKGVAAARVPRSILFLARMAESKRPDMLLEALRMLKERGVMCTASFVGSPLPQDEAWYETLIARADTLGLSGMVSFKGGVSNADAAVVFHSHEVFVNTSPSGMFDKTIFEAAASGCIVLAASDDYKEATSAALHFTTAAELAERLEAVLSMPEEERARVRETLNGLVQKHTLSNLAAKLSVSLT